MSELTPEQQAAADAAAAEAQKAAAAKKVKARVLAAGIHGQPNDVVLVDPSVLKADNAEGGPRELDGSKAAVAYAESLIAGQA